MGAFLIIFSVPMPACLATCRFPRPWFLPSYHRWTHWPYLVFIIGSSYSHFQNSYSYSNIYKITCLPSSLSHTPNPFPSSLTIFPLPVTFTHVFFTIWRVFFISYQRNHIYVGMLFLKISKNLKSTYVCGDNIKILVKITNPYLFE